MPTFSQSVRKEMVFSPNFYEKLVECTVAANISYVVQALMSNNRPGPRLENDGKTSFLIHRKMKDYVNEDGNKKK